MPKSHPFDKSASSATILVAEDEQFVRDLSVRILQQSGYNTIAASDGGEAVRAFEANQAAISALLLDLVMPEMGGREVYERVRLHQPDIRVVFMTGYDPENAHPDFEAGERTRLIQKPFEKNELLDAVRAVLD